MQIHVATANSSWNYICTCIVYRLRTIHLLKHFLYIWWSISVHPPKHFFVHVHLELVFQEVVDLLCAELLSACN